MITGMCEYPDESFDVVISMDTMYFAKDMSAFVNQIMSWLKKMEYFLHAIKRTMLCLRQKMHLPLY